VYKVISKFSTCHMTKNQFRLGLYSLLPTLNVPWEHVSSDFIVSLLSTQRGEEAVMVMVDWSPLGISFHSL